MTYSDPNVELRSRTHRTAVEGSSAVGVAEMTHAEVRGLLSSYLDGSLSTSEVERVREHLAACASCLAFYNTFLQTVRLAGELPSHRLPESSKRRIIERLKEVLPVR